MTARRRPGAGWMATGLLALALLPRPAHAEESASCKQARLIVEEVEKLYASARPDHQRILNRLATARDLCPALGLAWKFSYCSAQALGQDRQARIYQDRAVLNGVEDLGCSVPGVEAVPAPLPPPGPVRSKYALVIGIGTFQDHRITRLKFPAKDARDLHEFLVAPGGGRFPPGNVFLLVDEKATRKEILTALQKLFVLAQPDDLVLIYVSSHGSPRQREEGLQGVGYIVTWDTNVDSLYVDALDFQDFSEKIALLKARRKVTFLDTCYSGQVAKEGGKSLSIGSFGVGEDTAKLFLSGEGTYVITSSSESEQSWESQALQNSFFTYYLLESLRQGGDPPTLKEVYSSLLERVSQAVAREKGARQTPQLHPKSGVADLRIGVAPSPSLAPSPINP